MGSKVNAQQAQGKLCKEITKLSPFFHLRLFIRTLGKKVKIENHANGKKEAEKIRKGKKLSG